LCKEEEKKERDPLHLFQIIVIFSPLIPNQRLSLLRLAAFLTVMWRRMPMATI